MRISSRTVVSLPASSQASPGASTPPTSQTVMVLGYLAVAALLLLHPDRAFAQLEKGTNALQQFKDWLWLIIPICATMIGGLVGLAYSADMIRKDTAIQWGVGVVFAGAIAGGFIKYFWG